MIMTGTKVETDTALLAAAVDRLSMLVWAKTKDAPKGRNKPKSILGYLTKEERAKSDDLMLFDNAEDFEAARKRIIQKGG